MVSTSTTQRLEAWLRYADDLRLGPYFRNRTLQQTEVANSIETASPTPEAEPPLAAQTMGEAEKPTQGAAMSPASAKPAPAPIIVPATTGVSLFEEESKTIRSTASGKTSARIAPAANSTVAQQEYVFGVGNPKAQLVFVGEGPGRDEDEQGEPFVGRAGKLLT